MLLYDESPITVSPTLATELGLSTAVLLQQIHFWIDVKRKDASKYSQSFKEGRWWVYFSTRELSEKYPYIGTERTIKAKMAELIEQGWLIKGRFNRSSFDRTNWYTINYEKIRQFQVQRESEINARAAQSIMQNDHDSLGENNTMESDPITRPIPETSTENSNRKEYAQAAHAQSPFVRKIQIPEFAQTESLNPEPVQSQASDPNPPQVPPHPPAKPKRADTGPAFAEFWALYPVKRDRKRAEKVWQAMPAADRTAVLVDVPRRVTGDAQWVAGFRPYPSTYLTGRRWEDELQGAQSVPAAMAAEQQQKAVEQAVAKSEFSTFIETLSVGARLVSTSGKQYAVEYLDPGKQYARAVLDGTRQDLNVTAQNFHLLSLEG